MKKYNHSQIEKKWQAFWQAKKTFTSKDAGKDKKFVLVEFPYPSGAGLHMGHLRPYVAADTYARFQRLLGKQVLFPIGWDAFGLPAENYAIKMGVHPSITTKKNVANAKKQMQSWGLSFDWAREINTTDPSYYKWTQWLFLQFYKKGLAYEATGLINWCPKDKTGLANEEVIDGKCERCGTVVEKKELRQWYLKITAYAEKLLQGLKELPEWPEAVKLQQENWIGKKTGINIGYEFDYSISSASEKSLQLENQRDPSQSLGMVTKPNYLILHGRGSGSEKVFLPWLKSELEAKGFKVQVPNMPGGDEPSDLDQTEYILKNCEINENTVVLGHSFGGIVAMRLLEKGVKVNKVVFVATPYLGRFSDGKVRKSVSEAIGRGFDFIKIKQRAKSFVSLSDETDYIVPLSDGKELAEKVNGAFVKTKASQPHFNSLQEPEIFNLLNPKVTVFTTRPDTNFGATFVVLGPEHPLLSDRNILNIEPKIWQEILAYQESTKIL
jgi:predicted alpha/beta hydrolase family esterase